MDTKYDFVIPEHPITCGVVVSLDDIKVDPQAQRSLNERRAQAMAAKLVVSAAGQVMLSRRPNGELFVVDGMHRCRAFTLAGMSTILAEVHEDLSVADEAALLLIKNRESSKPTSYDEFKVGLTGHLPLFVDVHKVLEAHGLSAGTSSSPNVVSAVSAIVKIVQRYGAPTLDRTLSVAIDAWGRTNQTWDWALLGGLGKFLGEYGEIVTDKELVAKLQRVGTAGIWISQIVWKSTAQGAHGSGGEGRIGASFNLIRDAWNKGKTKHRIPV